MKVFDTRPMRPMFSRPAAPKAVELETDRKRGKESWEL